MKKIMLISFLFLVLGPTSNSVYAGESFVFPPVPAEDRQKGINNNAYSCATGHPTPEEKDTFLNEIKPVAVELHRKYSVPASALVGMAVLESCHGYTRTGVYANNYFAIKKWTSESEGSYQLIGQPDEDKGKAPIRERLSNGQLIFDEPKRRDNRYRIFSSKADAMRFLVEEFLQKSPRYLPVIQSYQKRIKNGTSPREASRVFLHELADAGYNHKGGRYYRDKVGSVIDRLKLDDLDR